MDKDSKAKMHNFPLTIPIILPRSWILLFLLVSSVLNRSYGDKKVIPIGAILDVNTRMGKEQQVAMEIAVQNYNNTSKTHNLALYFRNSTTKDPFAVTSLAEELIETQKVQVIIGMHTWQEATLVGRLGTQNQVPIISFSSPPITPPLTPQRYPYLLRLANNVTSHIKCIADIIHSFTWQKVIAIYEDDHDADGYELLTLLSEALQDFGSTIEYRLALPPISVLQDPKTLIQQELIKLINQTQSRVFVVLQHTSLEMATHLFREASQIGLMSRDSAWIIPESITNELDYVDKYGISYMEGSLGIKTYYSEESKEYQHFQAQFKKKFRAMNPEEDNSNPGFYALQAYDSIKMVTQALENSTTNQSDFKREILLSRSFIGLSGEIHFEAGQLFQNPILSIVNIVGKSYKEIGFWTEELGFMNGKGNNNNDSAKFKTQGLVGVVQWPGNSDRIPKGWNMPITQKPMRIAVPGRTSFSKFVKVKYGDNPAQNEYYGFCIEIFKMVLGLLDYDLPYEFYPLNVTYPDLVQLVYNKTYDAVVGDMTLLADRLQYVDFTVPYTESGLSMIVPTNSKESTWMFLKPFSWQLWLVTGAILLYTMLVVWQLERVPNPDFHGTLKTQISTALWFTFSSLFFAHRENMRSHLSRVVMVAWLFLVMILSSSYTASLSSILTVRQLQSNVTNIEWLLRNNKKVGCDGDSFVRTYLENVLAFKKENIVNISSEYNYDGEFRNNTIAAAFLELPYEKVYINTYCTGYTGFTPTTRFGGLGFMFQKGSPVAKDVSKAILQLSEQGRLKNLEEKWLYSSDECSTSSSSNDTESLKLGNFWVLYVISGVTSTICLLFSIISSSLRSWQSPHQDVVQQGNDESLWRKAFELAKHYNNSKKHEKESSDNDAEQDVTDCNSSSRDCVSTIDTPMHNHHQQQDNDSTVPEITVISTTSSP